MERLKALLLAVMALVAFATLVAVVACLAGASGFHGFAPTPYRTTPFGECLADDLPRWIRAAMVLAVIARAVRAVVTVANRRGR